MPRIIWKGSISFGLVEIPVVLKPAETRDEISFHQVDKRDHSPVGYKRVNKRTGREVAWADVVKGYEYAKGKYVLFDESELRGAAPKMTRTVDIVEFVDAAELDPVYFEAPYYLEPATKASKGYALLREILKQENKVGIAKVVL